MFALASFGIAPEPAAAVHPMRAAQIAEINAANTTWKAAAHPRFSTEAPGASKGLLGLKGNWQVDIADAIKRGEMERYVPTANVEVPTDWDAATAFPKCAKTITDIRDQSNCGCCWAFGGAEAASDRMCIASDAELLMPLSAQDICFNSNFDGCDGGQISTPWSYISRTGVVTGGQNKGIGPFGAGYCSAFSLPHCHHHGPTKDDPYPAEGAAGCPSESSPRGPSSCDASAEAPHNSFSADKYTFSGRSQSASGAAAIKQFMMEGGPCEVAFTVYSDFENYDTGIYKHTSGSFAGGHAVKFVGWGVENGQEYWKVANSWNPYWGESGYFRIAPGEGGIDAECVGSAATATWSKK
jgi:cathepsin B